MSGFVGILVSDPWLQNQFTQVELRSLKSHVRTSDPLKLKKISISFLIFRLFLIEIFDLILSISKFYSSRA